MEESYGERKRRLQKIMLIISLSLPLATALCVFLRFIIGNHREHYLLLGVSIFFVSCYFGRYLYRRSNNLKAQFWLLSVDPDEWEPFGIPVDWLVLSALLAVFFFSIFAT